MGVEDHDIDIVAAHAAGDCGAAGVARGGAEYGGALAGGLFLQGSFEQLANELESKIFEGEGWAVEKFEEEMVVGELRQRRDGFVAEAAIGVIDHALHVGAGEAFAEEGEHDFEGEFVVRQAG